jgi:cysteinyl-tRNA synthetase
MWSIFQLQDILGIDVKIRRANPHEERINVPSDPKNHWAYRMHFSLADLMNAKEFNDELEKNLEAAKEPKKAEAKLFLEHSTTKSEKDTIIKRFDEITSLTESKRLYKTIANELKNRKPISEALESKIIKESTTSTSSQLNESTAYVDPSTKRIMDLIKRVENRE